jgi:site-specific recombinase XerD
MNITTEQIGQYLTHLHSEERSTATIAKYGREVSCAEYERLLNAAKSNERLNLLMQAICSTGIRVSDFAETTPDEVFDWYTEVEDSANPVVYEYSTGNGSDTVNKDAAAVGL